MKLEEKRVKENLVYDGKIIKVYSDDVLLPNGVMGKREKIKHSGGTGVFAIDGDECYLVEQFRYAYGKTILEIPAGKLEKQEDPKTAALRELEEEIGYTASSIEHLITYYPTVGYTDEILYIYIAEGLKETNRHLDEDEFMNVKKVKIKELYQMILNNEIQDSKTIIAVLTYLSKK